MYKDWVGCMSVCKAKYEYELVANVMKFNLILT